MASLGTVSPSRLNGEGRPESDSINKLNRIEQYLGFGGDHKIGADRQTVVHITPS